MSNTSMAQHENTKRPCYAAGGALLGLLLSVALFYCLFVGRTTRFEEAAFGADEAHFAVINGVHIHCKNLADAGKCINPAVKDVRSDKILWLGNSQLHAINQNKLGDRSAPEILHGALRARNKYVVAFSQPSANLQEELVLFAYLLPRLKPRALLLPLVFDDFRETGIRAELQAALRDEQAANRLSKFDIGRASLKEYQAGDAGDFAGVTATVQDRSERALDSWLNEHWRLWSARREARGEMLLFLYQARNTIFGIKPTTSRKAIPGPYAKNLEALRAICALAKEAGVRVFLYVVPLRSDVKIPYDEAEYTTFKAQMKEEFSSQSNVTFANLENVVANDLWGVKASTSLTEQTEYDFMHFRGKGHEALANALFKLVTAQHDL